MNAAPIRTNTAAAANRTRSLMTAAVASLSLIAAVCATATPSRAAGTGQPLGSASQECNQVFTDAKNLPEPNAKSIYNYGSTLVDQSGRCLQAAGNELTGPSAPDPAPSDAPDNGGGSSDDGQ
jgi:hypothetical protein